MTRLQILLFAVLYLIVLVVVIYVARATARRVMGALVGAAVAGLMALGAIVLCVALELWKVPFASTPYFIFIFYVGLSITLAPLYIVTWRIDRRFGWRGIALATAIVGIIGPPRDYMYAATFPEWMVFSPGVAPVIADSLTYIGIMVLGHYVMRLVAGPVREDRLARTTV